MQEVVNRDQQKSTVVVRRDDRWSVVGIDNPRSPMVLTVQPRSYLSRADLVGSGIQRYIKIGLNRECIGISQFG